MIAVREEINRVCDFFGPANLTVYSPAGKVIQTLLQVAVTRVPAT